MNDEDALRINSAFRQTNKDLSDLTKKIINAEKQIAMQAVMLQDLDKQVRLLIARTFDGRSTKQD